MLLVGCTGLVGQVLIRRLLANDQALRVVVRSSPPPWLQALVDQHPQLETRQWEGGAVPLPPAHLDGCSAVVNLAGAPVADGRWTSKRKDILSDSRIATTQSLVATIAENASVKALVNASGISVYGFDRPPADEESPTHGDHFLAELALEWEAAAQAANKFAHCRAVSLRIGVVLSGEGGPLKNIIPGWMPRFLPLVPLADGKQGMPWVHVDDVVGMICTALGDERWQGVVNAVAPEQVDNAGFTRQAARHSGHWYFPFGPPVWLLRLILGEMASIITGDISVVPKRAQELGYVWQHDSLASALVACGYTYAAAAQPAQAE